MRSRGLARLIGVALVSSALAHAAPSSPVLRGRFIGNMAVQLSDGAVTLRTDFPYESGYSGYMSWTGADVPPAEGEALCLVTHAHRDHFAPALAARYCDRLVGPRTATGALPGRALALAKTVVHGPLRITPLATAHAGLEHYSYLVEWAGLRLYFSGDTDDTETLLALRGLDVAFVSPWLLRSATAGGRRIAARRVIVYHHRAGEAVQPLQDRELPRQGEELLLRKE